MKGEGWLRPPLSFAFSNYGAIAVKTKGMERLLTHLAVPFSYREHALLRREFRTYAFRQRPARYELPTWPEPYTNRLVPVPYAKLGAGA